MPVAPSRPTAPGPQVTQLLGVFASWMLAGAMQLQLWATAPGQVALQTGLYTLVKADREVEPL